MILSTKNPIQKTVIEKKIGEKELYDKHWIIVPKYASKLVNKANPYLFWCKFKLLVDTLYVSNIVNF